MKKTIIGLITIAMVLLTSCQKDPDIPLVRLVVQDTVAVEWTNADLSGTAVSNTKIEDLYLQCDTNESFSNYIEIKTTFASGKFTIPLTQLTPQTTYYYRYRGANKLGSCTNEQILSFKTKDYIVPIVTTDSTNKVTGKKATIYGTMAFDCGKEIRERGFEYGMDSTNLIKVAADTEGFVKQLSQLKMATTYYYRAYAVSEIGTGYGHTKTFTTCDVVKFGDIQVTDITANSAKAQYSILSNGGMSVIKQGLIYWRVGAKDTTYTETQEAANLTQLLNNQKYQVQAFAVTEDSCYYSAVKDFTTKNGIIKLTTSDPIYINYESASLGGQITDDGGAVITKRGICWSQQNHQPTTSDSKQIADDNPFGYVITQLSNNTTYYYRAYAINQYGTYYGVAKSFTTLAFATPTVTTSDVTNISYTTATCGGNVTDDGGQSVTERGVCYSTSSNPTTSDSKVKSRTGTGSFTRNLTDLADGKTYYVRAYAINSKGISYGAVKSFTTKQYTTPTVTTSDASNVTYNSAICGGNVTSDGGQSVTERGVCYSTTSNPTTSDSKANSGIGIGNFTCNLAGLTDGNTYYVRAYATNSKGTSYGNVKSFTTADGTENGHTWVDLGMSVKWATMNVGATTVTGYGYYYAWGETSPKTEYDWDTYTHCNGSDSMTKYCTSSSAGIIDNKTTLEKADDAASMNWGGNWRMPTHAEQEELINNCIATWTSDYQKTGIAGYIFTSKKTGYTDKSIFLPAAGSRSGTSLYEVGSLGNYWSSSLFEGYSFSSGSAWLLSQSSFLLSTVYIYRFCGESIRPVCP